MIDNRGDVNDVKFAVPYKNLTLILIGLGVIVLGYVFMSGGGTSDPQVFTGEEMFSFRRITLSTIFIVLGFAIEVFAILYRPKKRDK